MNLFLLAWNLSERAKSVALAEMQRMIVIYPYLDLATLQYWGGKAFAISLCTADSVAKPRVYNYEHNGLITLYDGVPCDIRGEFRAYDARNLHKHWPKLTETLEGQFVIAQMSSNAISMEVITDPLGIYQVYYFNTGNTWLISNSVELISRICNNKDFDPLGISLYLGMGWASGDRTLRRDIAVIPGGERWSWNNNVSSPIKHTYFSRKYKSEYNKKALSKEEISSLAESLTSICKELNHYNSVIECPLTAGRDSRLMAALLINAGISAQYFSTGPRNSADVRTGNAIAQQFDLPHRSGDNVDTDDYAVLRHWDEASRCLLQRSDGMVTLAHIANALSPPKTIDKLHIHLYGVAGELARSSFFRSFPSFYFLPQSYDNVQRLLITRLMARRRELLLPTAIHVTEKYLKGIVTQAADEGFPPVDVENVFYTYERARRWGGTNFRQVNSFMDVFSPFCTRPFLIAGFSSSAQRRYADHVHYELFKMLNPKLSEIPFERAWRAQNLPMLWVQYINQLISSQITKQGRRIQRRLTTRTASTEIKSKRSQRKFWLETKLSDLRSLCLDQANSDLWFYINRGEFERITSTRGTAKERDNFQDVLFDIFSVFQYEALSHEHQLFQPDIKLVKECV